MILYRTAHFRENTASQSEFHGIDTGIRRWFAGRALLLAAGLLCASLARADMTLKSCVPKPGTTDFAYGELVSCEVKPVGDSNLFRFTGQAGDYILVNIFRYSDNADQCYQGLDAALIADLNTDNREVEFL